MDNVEVKIYSLTNQLVSMVLIMMKETTEGTFEGWGGGDRGESAC